MFLSWEHVARALTHTHREGTVSDHWWSLFIRSRHGFFKDWENAGLREYITFYGREINFFNIKVFFFLPEKKGSGCGRAVGKWSEWGGMTEKSSHLHMSLGRAAWSWKRIRQILPHIMFYQLTLLSFFFVWLLPLLGSISSPKLGSSVFQPWTSMILLPNRSLITCTAAENPSWMGRLKCTDGQSHWR